ncbi:ABC transporter ATP-binding protein, partial [Campylobacter jejuni]|nr:ABC transporter ATP-binding protein [Campylobacter jejuni]
MTKESMKFMSKLEIVNLEKIIKKTK